MEKKARSVSNKEHKGKTLSISYILSFRPQSRYDRKAFKSRVGMKRKHALIMVLATVILAAVAFHSSTRKVPDKGIGGTSTGETSTSVVRQMAIASATSLAISQDEIGRKDARRQLDLALAAVKGIATASEARQVLLELRAYLASLPPELASAVIADFLSDPSRDAPTRIEFSIGKTG